MYSYFQWCKKYNDWHSNTKVIIENKVASFYASNCAVCVVINIFPFVCVFACQSVYIWRITVSWNKRRVWGK